MSPAARGIAAGVFLVGSVVAVYAWLGTADPVGTAGAERSPDGEIFQARPAYEVMDRKAAQQRAGDGKDRHPGRVRGDLLDGRDKPGIQPIQPARDGEITQVD
jgi:hypothetical protein